MRDPRLLIVGRDKDAIAGIDAGVAPLREEISIEQRYVVNGFMDPLHGIDPLPDVLILALSAHARDELTALGRRPRAARTHTLVIAQEQDARTTGGNAARVVLGCP